LKKKHFLKWLKMAGRIPMNAPTKKPGIARLFACRPQRFR